MFAHDAQPQSVDDWLTLSLRDEEAAKALARIPGQEQNAWGHAGHAVECALKAAIMAREGLNQWPERSERRDLYDHDLARLARLAHIEFETTAEVGVCWAVVLIWRRGQTYNPIRMPRRIIDDMIEAAFGAEGVVPWIKTNCLRRT